MNPHACEDCVAPNPAGCVVCDKKPARFARIHSKPIWKGFDRGKCILCSEEHLLDIAEICEECNEDQYDLRIRDVYLCDPCATKYGRICKKCGEGTDVYAEGTAVCPTCFYGDDFTVDLAESGRHSKTICKSCGEYTALNAEGDCRNCYVEMAMMQATTGDWGNTKVCPECRKITKRGMKVCTSCSQKKHNIKTCMGCTNKFQPPNNKESFCSTCLAAKLKNLCTSCGKPRGEYDEHGWCTKCQHSYKP